MAGTPFPTPMSSRLNGARKSPASRAHLFKFELDRWRVHGRDRIRDLVSNPERLFLGFTLEIDEHRIRIPIHDPRAPFLRGVDDSDGLGYQETTWVLVITTFETSPPNTYLFERLSTALYDTVCNLHRRHPPRIRRARIAVRNIGDILESELPRVQYPAQCLHYHAGGMTNGKKNERKNETQTRNQSRKERACVLCRF